MPQVLKDTTPVARKRYRCDWCWTPIEPGTKYRRLALLGDDGLYEWIECTDCSPIVSPAYTWAGGDLGDGITDEELHEWAIEHVTDPGWGEQGKAFLERWRANHRRST